MAVTVKLPTILRKHAGGEAKVGADGATLRDVLTDLEGHYPGITKNVIADDGGLHRFINVYLNDEDVRTSGPSRRKSRTATRSRSSRPSRGLEVYPGQPSRHTSGAHIHVALVDRRVHAIAEPVGHVDGEAIVPGPGAPPGPARSSDPRRSPGVRVPLGQVVVCRFCSHRERLDLPRVRAEYRPRRSPRSSSVTLDAVAIDRSQSRTCSIEDTGQ